MLVIMSHENFEEVKANAVRGWEILNDLHEMGVVDEVVTIQDEETDEIFEL